VTDTEKLKAIRDELHLILDKAERAVAAAAPEDRAYLEGARDAVTACAMSAYRVDFDGHIEPPEVWAWATSADSEDWCGPFDTRAEAEQDCRDTMDDAECSGSVAPAIWPDVAEVASRSIDLEDMLDRMETYAYDNALFSGDDSLFDVELSQEAETALTDMVARWARKYVQATAFTVDIKRAEPVLPLSKEDA
jgi:hypothetical protein